MFAVSKRKGGEFEFGGSELSQISAADVTTAKQSLCLWASQTHTHTHICQKRRSRRRCPSLFSPLLSFSTLSATTRSRFPHPLCHLFCQRNLIWREKHTISRFFFFAPLFFVLWVAACVLCCAVDVLCCVCVRTVYACRLQGCGWFRPSWICVFVFGCSCAASLTRGLGLKRSPPKTAVITQWKGTGRRHL